MCRQISYRINGVSLDVVLLNRKSLHLDYSSIICESKVELGGRIDKSSMKYRPSTLQGGEDYPTVSKLCLADREMDKLFNEDR